MVFTTHKLARELLEKEDSFLTVTVGDREYSIEGIKVARTCANSDDYTLHRTLICNETECKNIIR